ncbi:MAG: site-specific integrase [Propionibacteriaceae bacterium]|nr:site-specific integrase [Propionibacteriaceae bacterium]
MSPRPRVIDPGNLTCARCHRPARLATREPSPARGKIITLIRNWPDGKICSGCYANAAETFGTCQRCGTHRLLPGRGPDGELWCSDCAGIPSQACARCGREGWLEHKQTCGWCVLGDKLTTALDDGTGRIRPELQPFYDRIVAMPRPRTGILWLNKPHVQPLLHKIATGQVPLTHDGITSLTPARSASYVRRLLVAAGTLPDYDHYLDRFERWLPGWLDTIPDPDHRQILTRYAKWHVHRHLRNAATDDTIGPYREQTARRQLRVAAAFLTDLQAAGRPLERCTQAHLDAWLATATCADKTTARDFLSWTIRTRIAPRLRLPPVKDNPATVISQQHRLEILRRILTDAAIPTVDRVVATLILLYAQRLQRILALRLGDITDGAEGLTINLTGTAVDVPAPFDELIRAHLVERTTTIAPAANTGSDWLFPGRLAGHPIQPTGIRAHLQRLGIPNAPGRSRALRELVLQAPPAVIAPLLGYKAEHAEKIAAEAGNTWQRYAAGTHTPLTGTRP